VRNSFNYVVQSWSGRWLW